jgi:hypothetical protein
VLRWLQQLPPSCYGKWSGYFEECVHFAYEVASRSRLTESQQ